MEGRSVELLFKKGRGLYYYYPKDSRKIYEVRREDNWEYHLRGNKKITFWNLDYLLKHWGDFGEYKVFLKDIKPEREWKVRVDKTLLDKLTRERKVVAFPKMLNKNRLSLKKRERLGLEHNGELLLEWGNLSCFIGREHCWADINCDTNKKLDIKTISEREVYVFDIAKIYSYEHNGEKKKKVVLWMMMPWTYILSKELYNQFKCNEKEKQRR